MSMWNCPRSLCIHGVSSSFSGFLSPPKQHASQVDECVNGFICDALQQTGVSCRMYSRLVLGIPEVRLQIHCNLHQDEVLAGDGKVSFLFALKFNTVIVKQWTLMILEFLILSKSKPNFSSVVMVTKWHHAQAPDVAGYWFQISSILGCWNQTKLDAP